MRKHRSIDSMLHYILINCIRVLFKRFKDGRRKQCTNWDGGAEIVFREGLHLNWVLDDVHSVEKRGKGNPSRGNSVKVMQV